MVVLQREPEVRLQEVATILEIPDQRIQALTGILVERQVPDTLTELVVQVDQEVTQVADLRQEEVAPVILRDQVLLGLRREAITEAHQEVVLREVTDLPVAVALQDLAAIVADVLLPVAEAAQAAAGLHQEEVVAVDLPEEEIKNS